MWMKVGFGNPSEPRHLWLLPVHPVICQANQILKCGFSLLLYIVVEKSLIYLRETSHISPQEKTIFFRRVAKSLGTTALCLSGGATFGYCKQVSENLILRLNLACILHVISFSDHFGVLRALLDAGLIPTVITGTSAGALGMSTSYASQKAQAMLIIWPT